MYFYSSCVILIGILLIGLGFEYAIKPKSFINSFRKSQYKNFTLFLNLNAILGFVFGSLLLISGIISFILEFDLIFSIVFASLITIYLLISYFVKKKNFIKIKPKQKFKK